MAEHWRTIHDFDSYEVSDLGRIRRIRDSRNSKAGRILKGRTNRVRSDRIVRLYRAGQWTDFLVARLVATTFIGPCPPAREIDHLNGDWTDNRASNLEWVTRKENVQRAVLNRQGQYKNRLSVEVVRSIRNDRRPSPIVAASFSTSAAMVRQIWRRARYAWVPD